MPRIRYLKKKLEEISPIIVEEVENEETLAGVTEDENGQASTILGPPTMVDGRGWWSSPTVIASLPASKIKQAIRYHKDMLHILQCELLSRTNDNPRISYPDYEFLSEHFEQDFAKQSRRSKREIKKARRNRIESKTAQFCKILEQAKLSPEKIKELTQCLVLELQKAKVL